jgi:hypothetical protein
MPRARSIALAAGVALALILPSSAQAAANPKFYGVFYGFFNGMNAQDLERMDRGGVGSARWVMLWNQAEPHEGRFNWSTPDDIIGDLASRGIDVMPTLYGTPSYMADNNAKPPVFSERAREGWKNFVRLAVERYGPDGYFWTNPALYPSQHPEEPNPTRVRAFQVWNEPNLKRFFHPRPSARKYVQLLRISAKAVRSVDSEATVVMAGMPPLANPSATEFLDRVYDLGGKPYFDVAALHPYAPSIRGQKKAFQRMRGVMRRHHDGGSDMWATEMGWGSGPRRLSKVNRGPEGQARMLKKSFGLMLRNRQEWNLTRVFWFEWRDPPHGGIEDCGFCGYSGLFKDNFEPKPAWRAFKRVTP